jgi:signal transduction histidine kinase
MHGYADALDEDFGNVLPGEAHEFTRRIKAAAMRMEGLIEDILTYSRLARSEVSLRPTSLEAAVDQVLGRLSNVIVETRAAIEVQRPLPEVHAHPPTLAQVIENLVSNALKFIVPGSPPEIGIGAERRGNMIRLVIEDHGIGVSPEHQSRIFRPFERLHGVESYPGTGIGLAIVRRAVERMGGTCGVEANPDGGSRFWFELRGEKDDHR